jgi:regulatory protein RepA
MASIQPIDIWKIFQEKPETIDYVLPGMVAGTIGALIGPGGLGKSILSLQLASQVAGGPDLLGMGNMPSGNVLYFPAEDPRSTIEQRLHALGAHLNEAQRKVISSNLLVFPLVGRSLDIMDSNWFNNLVQIANGKRLMVIDTLRRFHKEAENDSSSMGRVLERLESISSSTGCSVLFIHHANKGAIYSGVGDQQQASRGSSVLVDHVRWQGFICPMQEEEAKTLKIDSGLCGHFLRFGISKQNYGPPLSPKWLKRHDGGILKQAVFGSPKNNCHGGRNEL